MENIKSKILEILNKNTNLAYGRGSCGELGDSENVIFNDDFDHISDEIISILNIEKYLIKVLSEFHNSEYHFRLEDDEEMYYLSIIDRTVYPRIWADNFTDNKSTIIAETNESFIQRSMIQSKDWVERFEGDSVEECLYLAKEWLIKSATE